METFLRSEELKIQEGCGGLQREYPGACLILGPVAPKPFLFPENPQTLAGTAL